MIEINDIIYDIDSIHFYQNNYILASLYYQENSYNIYIWINENYNEFDFDNKIIKTRYYISSIKNKVILNNISNPNTIKQSDLTKISTTITKTINTIIEKPIINPFSILKNIEFYINEQLIETLDENIFNLYYYYYLDDEKRKQFTKLTQVKEGNDYQIYVPLIFWFYNNATLALPLVAMEYTELYIKYQINNINNILQNDLTSTKLSIIPQLNIEIGLDTIILEQEERRLFITHKNDYLIERYLSYPTKLIYLDNQVINIKYANLIKNIFMISKPIYHNTLTAYQNITYSYDIKYQEFLDVYKLYLIYKNDYVLNETNINYVSNFNILKNIDEEIITSSTRINSIKNDGILKNYDIIFILYIMDKYLTDKILINQIKALRLYFTKIYKNDKPKEKM
jgi:hypothetical protein